MTRAWMPLLALAALVAAGIAGCQSPPAQPPATATVPTAAAPAATAPVPANAAPALLPTLNPAISPAPASAASTPPPTPAPTVIALATATTAPPTPTQASPTLLEVPVTDAPLPVPIMPSRDHFPPGVRIQDVAPDGYSTVPPTSGRHWPAWSACGFFNHPLPDELLVHNLEHGNIIVSYNLPDDASVAALRAAVANIPLAAEFAIIRRYPAIPEGMVAITAWGVVDRMLGVKPERIARFFTAYPGNTGPEFANGYPCTTGIDFMRSTGG